MTYKSAVAGLPLGGGKGVIVAAARASRWTRERRRDALLDFGDTVERLGGSYVTAEDVGTSTRDMAVIAKAHRARHRPVAPRAAARATRARSPRSASCTRSRRPCERAFGTRVAARAAPSPSSASATSACASPRLLRRGGRAAASSPTSTAPSATQAERLGARWTTPAKALTAAVDVLVAVRAGRRPRPRDRPAAAGAGDRRRGQQPARRRPTSPTCCASAASSGRRTSSPTRAASSTSRSSSSPRATTPPRDGRDVRGIGDTLRRIFDDAEARRHDAARRGDGARAKNNLRQG